MALIWNPDKRSIEWIKGALIGSGSSGDVYLGMDAVQGQLMAVKRINLPADLLQKRELKEDVVGAWERGIDRLKQLQYENIVKYLGKLCCSIDAQHLDLFIEYIPGGSIAALLLKYGAFEETLVRNWVRQILQGLNYPHEQEVIHHAIKGSNILVDNKGCAKISDFWASVMPKNEQFESMLVHPKPFVQESIFWMAPEVVKQTSYTYRADIWSVGCLVVEMLTGQHPWVRLTQIQVASKLEGAMKPAIPPNISREAKDFLTKTFEVDCAIRPSAADLLDDPWFA
ncbi:ATP binding [Ceratobasidium sp. 392]|nr:ATP binding [Ceratobasidium sp. 392]